MLVLPVFTHRVCAVASITTSRAACISACVLASTLFAQADATAVDAVPMVTAGERISAAALSPGVIETMDIVLERQALGGFDDGLGKEAGRVAGTWVVPSRNASTATHSGQHYITNKGGDPSMSITFPTSVTVHDFYIHGQGGQTVWAKAVRVIGMRDGEPVGETAWFENISATPKRMRVNPHRVDRIIIEARPNVGALARYGIDDFAFTPIATADTPMPGRVLLDFENTDWEQKLTGSSFAGLTWDTGAGAFLNDRDDDIVPAPAVPPGFEEDNNDGAARGADAAGGGGGPVLGDGTEATIITEFQAAIRGTAGSFSTPPDHECAAGPSHIVVVVNRVFQVFRKSDNAELVSTNLGAFLPGSNGDPRVVYDQHSGRFIVVATDFNTRIYLAVSMTSDPTGAWYKTNFVITEGVDAGSFPDHPTLGVDENGIYTASYMVGGPGMTLVAIDKAPLIAPSPSLGTLTAFRNLPFDGAIQPAHTYGSSSGEYIISRFASSGLRIRRVDGPLTSPTLTDLGVITVAFFNSPQDITTLGAGTPLDAVDSRLINAVYRDGLLWATHCVDNSGRAGIRWYAVDTDSMQLAMFGSVVDDVQSYMFPSIAVDTYGNTFIGATLCGPGTSPSAVILSRAFSDAPGVMSDPVIFRAGSGSSFNVIDGFGRNRWGDYSMTTLDPDGTSVWTIQEYVHGTDTWGTHIANARVFAPPANNVCTQSAQLGLEPTPFTTEFATGDPAAATACGDLSADIWYRFAVTRVGELKVTVDNADFDATVAIYKTSCPSGDDVPLACAQVVSGSAELTIPVTPNLWRIRIGSPTGAEGAGTVQAVVIAPLPCVGDCTPQNIDGTYGNGIVNIDDLIAILNLFGSCP
ncbi:MAG: hypothetical protein KC983_01235 [Phycisphaerales bacterium]|nr:hypothetical protein [Phycisphaerales bacterium]